MKKEFSAMGFFETKGICNAINHIEAAEAKSDISNVSGVAYSGGAINQAWCQYPIVIDLAGMEIAKQIPLLYNHQNEPDKRLGEVTATIDGGNKLLIFGGVDTGTEKGRYIVEAGKRFKWQLSIGASIEAVVKVETDEQVIINGQAFTGEFMKVTKSLLREVSVVAVGADKNTSLDIAAAFSSAGFERLKTITAICEGHQDILESAIRDNWSIEAAQAAIEHIKGEMTMPNIISKQPLEINRRNLEAALCLQCYLPEHILLKSYKERELEAASQIRGITLKKVMEICCGFENRPIDIDFNDSTIRAAFSTVALPGILSNVANKKALQAFESVKPIAPRLCREGELNNFKPSERYRLTDVGDLQKIERGGEIQHGTFTEDRATNRLDTYGKMFTLTRQDIYNDDLGAFLQIPTALGQRAARKIDQVFFGRLLENPTFTDGKALFCADHKNYMTGTASALTKESLEKARALFLAACDSDGQPINVAPKFLLVPSELDSFAQTLVFSSGMTGGTTTAPELNIISRYRLEPISSPYLQSETFNNASYVGWYLFGDPNQIDTFEIAYLNGQKTPVVETGAPDFNTLGLSFRVVYDFGIREQAYQGMVFSKGME